MRIYNYLELKKELEKKFDVYNRKMSFKVAYKAHENFCIVSNSGPYTPDDNQKYVEGKKGDYIIKGVDNFHVISQKNFEYNFEKFIIKEDFDNVFSFYKRKKKDDRK
jgi:hypothetical protein